MKSFYSFTLVLGTLVMAYWPSLAQGIRCRPQPLIPVEDVRADMNKAVAAWRNASPVKELISKGKVTQWECYNLKLLPSSACADYAQRMFQEVVKDSVDKKQISSVCSGSSGGNLEENQVQVIWRGN